MSNAWFDSHCHFDFPEFDADREQVWDICRSLGVTGIMLPGVTPDQWRRSESMCQCHHGWFYSVGIHPHWTDVVGLTPENSKQQLDLLRPMILHHLQSPQCRAVGETGLDELINTPRHFLETLLVWHLQLAIEFHKPVILHSVRAHHYLLPILRENRPLRGGVIHAFSGSYETAKQYWDLGFYLGIGGTISYERAAKTRDAIARMPLESMVLETDAPDMPLQGSQGQRNSPEKLIVVAECLARLCNKPLEDVAQQTFKNTTQLFGELTD